MDKNKDYFEHLDKVFNGDRTMMYKACQSFLKHSDNYLQLMIEACNSKNGPELTRIAHSFKSSFVMFGDIDASDAASELEEIGRENNWEGSQIIMEKFSEILGSVRMASQEVMSNNTDCAHDYIS